MMKRRQLIRYAGASLLTVVGTGLVSGLQTYQAQTNNFLTVQWLGHSCFLFTSNGKRVLVNPFEKLGCTAKYRSAKVAADLVLISSLLLDEGSVKDLPGNPKIIYEPGAYEFEGIQIQGIGIDHDRTGGRQFGTNVAWRWQQAGINILHLGGAAAPINDEQKILMGSPDLLLIPVGGGIKVYNPQEANQTITSLNPKVVIPTQYLTKAANANGCDLASVDNFLQLRDKTSVRQVNSDKLAIKPTDLPKNGTVIRVLSYKF
ncbi:MAG TPA: MBL fold metallo-hydrolase [Oculatellaceae cyanobacterium]|jgi:L-ascorbate metabolism protein UlaG (beta-lactamase superfamily)